MNKQEIEYSLRGLVSLKEELELSNGVPDHDYISAIDTAISALEQQLNGGWIPISEKLPEENGHYLVTYHEWSDGNYIPKYDDTRVKILRYQDAIFRMPAFCDKKAEQDIHREVLAWQHLPEPYKRSHKTDDNSFEVGV